MAVWLRLSAGISLRFVLTSDEEVDGRIGKGKNSTEGVVEDEIELFADVAHVMWKRHSLDDPSFYAAHMSVMMMRIIQMGKGPTLSKSVWYRELSQC